MPAYPTTVSYLQHWQQAGSLTAAIISPVTSTSARNAPDILRAQINTEAR